CAGPRLDRSTTDPLCVRLIVAEGLEEKLEAMDTWWRINRPARPHLFTEELALAFERITESPDTYPVYRETSRGTVHRTSMPKTKNQVCYVHRENEALIVVVSVWGGPRGRGPDL